MVRTVQSHNPSGGAPFAVDFDQAPLLVIWECTRACALACRHCRASAIDKRDPDELSTEEGIALLRQIKDLGTPIVVFTGGDPLQRDDLEVLIREAKGMGLRVCTIPAAPPPAYPGAACRHRRGWGGSGGLQSRCRLRRTARCLPLGSGIL